MIAIAKPNQKILNHIRTEQTALRRSLGYVWGYTHGRIYKISRILYYITTGFSAFMSFVMVLRCMMDLDTLRAEDPGSNLIPKIITNEAFSMAAIVILIACIVLIAMKKHLPVFLLSLPTAIAMFIVAYSMASPNFLPAGTITTSPPPVISAEASFVFFNVIPLMILALTSLIMFIIATRDNKEIKHIYETKMAKLYQKRSSKKGMMTDEEWQQALEEMEFEQKARNQNEDKQSSHAIFSDR